MHDFDYDVMQKKITARSARNVKHGRRSRKVSLPCDHMTRAEWKRRNGQVTTYNLASPMNWAELQKMPDDLKKQYIEKLRIEYNVNAVALSEMLGVSAQHLRKCLKEWGVQFPRGGGGRMREEDRNRWAAFANPSENPAEKEPEAEKTPQPAPKKNDGAAICSGTMVFCGSAGAAMRQVYDILGELQCKITITWEAEP